MINLIVGEQGSGKSEKLILDYLKVKSQTFNTLILQCWPCLYEFDHEIDVEKEFLTEEGHIQTRNPYLNNVLSCKRFNPFIEKIKDIQNYKYIFIDEIHHADYMYFMKLLTYCYNFKRTILNCYGHRHNKNEKTISDKYYQHQTMNFLLHHADNITILKKEQNL